MSNIIHPEDKIVNSNNAEVIFMGTPEFAVPILEKLADSDYRPVAVFCAPDKPVGRKQILTPPPIKVLAQKYDIPVYQPKDKIELANQLKTINYQLIVTAAYGIIFPKEVLDAPHYGCLNIHPSLLPKYRGPSPIQAAIFNGDAKTGVTIYKMDEKVDTGPIIARSEWPISNDKYTTPELSKKLSEIGAELLLKTLPGWFLGEITPTPQDDSQASYTKIIAKEDGKIDWQKSALEIEQQIRAYTPWPNSRAFYSSSKAAGRVEKSVLKILDANATEKDQGKQPGEIFLTADGDLAVQTGNGALIIKKLQLEGGKSLSAQDFLRGHKDIIGKILQ